MADLNPITIDSLPTANSLLSSDKIIVFESDLSSGQVVPKIYNAIDLSAHLVFKDDLDDARKKLEDFRKYAEEAMKTMSRTYIAKSEAADTYSTLAEMNAELKKLETKESFSERLDPKASKEELDKFYSKLLADISRMKAVLAASRWRVSSGEWAAGYKELILSKAADKPKEEETQPMETTTNNSSTTGG